MNFRNLVAMATLAVAIVLAVMTFGGNKTKAAGPTCTVPGDYATIQGAVNDVGCTTINVLPGAYSETVAIGRTLTLNGAQAGNNNFGTRNSNPASESTVTGVTLTGNVAVFTITAANVTINGFTVKNAVTAGAAMGITVSGLGSGASILNNIFDTITSPDPGGNGTAQAVYLTAGGPDSVNIENNEMKNVHSNRSAKGVLIGDNGGTNPSQNVQVKGNSIHDIISDTRGAYGVSVANVANVSGLEVRNNVIDNLTGLAGWAHAIGLEGDTPGVIVEGNSISDVIDLNPSPVNDAIAVLFESNPSFATAEVHNNNFDGVAYGIAVNPALTGGSVDGACNWWGSASGPGPVGPGTGAGVTVNVVYTPWLTSFGGSCVGPDADGDGITDSADNCPSTANPGQENNDGDALGDVCDPDDDNDGVADTGDNCPFTANPGQQNNDGDALGDVCDPDDDNDGVVDTADNCQFTANPGQQNNDGDTMGDVCDPDDDNDGVPDTADNCDFTVNPSQADTDGDGLGNACDPDDDNDGVLDGADLCPGTPSGTVVTTFGCPVAVNANSCKNGGWQSLFRANGTSFKNQGDCMQYVNTGK